MSTIPIVTHYRGIGIHDFQSSHRIELVVQPAIDLVLDRINDPAMLFEYGGDVRNPPEARLLAAHKYEAQYSLLADAHGGRAEFNLDKMRARTGACDPLGWADLRYYSSLLDVPPAPGSDRWPAARPPEYGVALQAAQGAESAEERRRWMALSAR